MGILGKIFGSTKAIGDLTEGIYNGVDKLVYTEQEKAENFQKVIKLYEPFKLAQRYLSLAFCVPYSAAWLATFIASFFLDDISTQLNLLSGTMGNIVLAIVAFYFAGGVVSGLKGKNDG